MQISKEIIDKDVKNLVSKQVFARWQAILSVFDFKIEYIKGESNSLPDYLTREFLQGSQSCEEQEALAEGPHTEVWEGEE